MKKVANLSTILLLAVISFSHCNNDKKIVAYNNGNDGTVDVTTMATPKGEKLRPAEDGPVRSALGEPKIDLGTFKLEVTGLVDSSFFLTWADIQDFPAVYSDTMLMYCVEGWEVWGNWKGILIKEILDKAGVLPEGSDVFFTCADGYTTSLPISYLIKYNAMLAYHVNETPLKEQNGSPLRVVAFGKFGYKWAKWVNKLEIVDRSQNGYWENYGYSDRADVPIDRRQYYEGPDAEPLAY